MIALPEAVPTRRFPSKSLLTALAFWLAGMLLAHGPMVFSGFRRLQQTRADSRLMHYMLEHEYRWITGDPHHRSLWDPPFFYPVRNAAASSETMVGVAPLYWIWRAVRVPPDFAFSFWMLTVSTLNFAAAWFFLRRILDRTPVAAGLGAFLFSFASMRLAHVGHPQLLAGFLFVLVLHALARIFRETDRRRAAPWIAIGAAAFVAQVHAGFYIAWFLTLALGLGLIWSLALPALRPAAIKGLRTHGPGLAAGAAAAALCLIPFVRHSLKAAADIGYRGYDEVELFLPRLQSWFLFGGDHWIFGRFSALGLFESLPRTFEQSIAPGLVTMVMAGLGLWRLRETPIGRLLLAVTITLFVCTLMLPGGISLWGLVYVAVPGAKAIRAVARVSMILLLPISAGAASLIDRTAWKKPVLIGVTLLSMLEQGRTTPSLDRAELRHVTETIVKLIDPGAEAFFLTDSGPSPSAALLDRLPLRVHLDAMMASLESGVPTINGYSGGTPPGWRFEGMALAPPELADVEKELQAWCREKGLDRRRVQWVQKGR